MLCFCSTPLFAKDAASGTGVHNTRKETDTAARNKKFKLLTPQLDTHSVPKPLLIGRISEIAQQAPLSPLSESPQPGTEISSTEPVRSYPANYEGLWSGTFVVEQITGGAKDGDSILYPGRTGNGRVGFVRSHRDTGTEVDPLPIVFFELTEENKMHLNIPVTQKHVQAHVGFGEAHNAVLGSGAIKNSHIVKNVIKMLSNGKSMEQQIVEESQIYSPRTQKTFSAARESIFQFSPLSANMMDAYLAAVEYTKDGSLMSKMMLHGRLMREKGAGP